MVKERINQRKQWKRATEEKTEGINVLQEESRSGLAILRRAEYLRKKRQKKEYVRTAFYRDPFKFVKGLLNQEKGGQLKATKSEVEKYLRNSYSDLEQCRVVGLPPGMPPLGEIAHKMDVRSPRWKEVEEVVRRVKALSAPGPNGVPYRVYKSAPDILKFLLRQIVYS